MYRWLIIMLNFPDMSRIYWSQWSLDSVGPKIDKTGIGCILLLLSHIFDIVLLGGRNWYWFIFFLLSFCFNWSFGIFYMLTHYKWLLENWNDSHVSKNILKFKLRMKLWYSSLKNAWWTFQWKLKSMLYSREKYPGLWLWDMLHESFYLCESY